MIRKPGGHDSREQSRPRSRCLNMLKRCFSNFKDFLDGRDIGFWNVEIETMLIIEILRHNPCWDVIFWTVKTFPTVEMSFFELSRPKVSIETMSRQIETPRPNDLAFQKVRYKERTNETFLTNWSDPRVLKLFVLAYPQIIILLLFVYPLNKILTLRIPPLVSGLF